MQPALNSPIPDASLAVFPVNGENSHQGLADRNPAPNPVREVCNFTVALGLQSTAVLNRVGPRSTGKIRDAESGDDYFGARYYGSSMGRFLSPDPKIMTARHLANPQKWNKYAYVINNPLMRFDPDGMDDCVVFRTVTAGANSKQWAAAEKYIEGTKDSQGRQNTFRMVEGEAATVQAYRQALATPDAHVVFVGHAAEVHGATKGIDLDNGDSEGKNGSNWLAVTPSSTPGALPDLMITGSSSDPIAASSVALFGCDTAALAGQYDTTTFTGVQSGPDGTELQTLDLGAASWVGAGGGKSGDAAAQSVINASKFPADQGDKIQSVPPKPPDQPNQ